MPPNYQQPYPYPPQYAPRPQNGGAIAVEAVLAFFGIYGVGWLMAGRNQVGIPLLIGGFVWDVSVLFISIFTAGVGACCLVPLHLTFVALSTILLATRK